MFTKLRKEPLLYFFLLAAVLFYFSSPDITEDDLTNHQIELSQAFLDEKKAQFFKATQKHPTEEELQYIVDRETSDEVLFREAWRLQLYVGDSVVRKRMIQKMGFVLEQGSADERVSEQEINDYYKNNSAEFVAARQFNLLHQLFSNEEDARSHLQSLSSENIEVAENPQGTIAFPLGNTFVKISSQKTQKFFGTDFYQQLNIEQDGAWQGVIKSRYGFHLVKLSNISPERTLDLQEAKESIERKLSREKSEASRLESIAQIKKRYQLKYPG